MTRFFIVFFAMLFLANNVSAQTPQQLEMLKKKGTSVKSYSSSSTVARNSSKTKEAVYFDEKTGKFIIPTNPNPKIIPMEDGSKAAIPMAKPDEEIMATRAGPDARMLRKMNRDEIKAYAEYLAQDRIFVATSKFRVTTTVSGMKYCQMQLSVKNNTPRRLDKIRITYAWGDVKTSASFSNINVLDAGTHDIALAGSVCDRVTEGAKYTIDTCDMQGLTENQCRMRVAEL